MLLFFGRGLFEKHFTCLLGSGCVSIGKDCVCGHRAPRGPAVFVVPCLTDGKTHLPCIRNTMEWVFIAIFFVCFNAAVESEHESWFPCVCIWDSNGAAEPIAFTDRMVISSLCSSHPAGKPSRRCQRKVFSNHRIAAIISSARWSRGEQDYSEIQTWRCCCVKQQWCCDGSSLNVG